MNEIRAKAFECKGMGNRRANTRDPSVIVTAKYCTISFKSTGGVTRDPFYLFDISAAAKSLRDTLKISAFEPEFLSFLPFFFFLGNLGHV
jgi:hypothetical protein